MYQTYETLLEVPKKALVFEEKRRNTSSESPLPTMCSDKYPYKHLSINIA